MKINFTILIFTCLIFGYTNIYGRVVTKETVERTTQSEFEGEVLSYSIKYSEFEEEYPNWTPKSDSPVPLSIPKAIQIAKNEILEKFEPKHGMEVHEVKFVSFPFTELWYYIVTVKTKEEPVTKLSTVDRKPYQTSQVQNIEIPVYLTGRVPKFHLISKKDHIQSTQITR